MCVKSPGTAERCGFGGFFCLVCWLVDGMFCSGVTDLEANTVSSLSPKSANLQPKSIYIQLFNIYITYTYDMI